MKKIIISAMLVISMLSTSVCVFAENAEVLLDNENCDIIMAEETDIMGETVAVEEIEAEVEVCNYDISCEKAAIDEDIETEEQITVLPMTVDEDGHIKRTKNDSMELMAESDDPIIYDVFSGDFFVDEEYFNVYIDLRNVKDLRTKLKITIEDIDGNVVATQQEAFYIYVSSNGIATLGYKMKRMKSIRDDDAYFVKFSYSGAYDLQFANDDVVIYPIPFALFKSVEVIDYDDNSYRITLANAKPGERYSFYYVTDWEPYGQEIEITATVHEDSSVFVAFGGEFSSEGTIYLCEEDAVSYYDPMDEYELYDFEYDEEYLDYYSGVGCDEYIPADADSFWVWLWEKEFGGQSYLPSDSDKWTAYMLDTTTGETVGTVDEKEFYSYDDGYGELEGKIKVTKKLNDTHKYILVFNDGYTIRTFDDFTVTSKKMLTGSYYYVSLSDKTSTRADMMPVGIKTFYTYIQSMNISNIKDTKIVLLDSEGKTVATSKFDKNNRFLMTASKAISKGKYTLKATYEDLVLIDELKFTDEVSGKVRQYVRNSTIYDGKMYMETYIEGNTLNPAKLNYKIEVENGDVINVKFHRILYTTANGCEFVVVADSEDIDQLYEYDGFLRIYSGLNYIEPAYERQMSVYPDRECYGLFIYNQFKHTDTGVEIFAEGLDAGTGKYTLCAVDDETETVKTISLTKKSGEQTLVASIADLNKITTKYPIDFGYGVPSKNFYVEKNGEYIGVVRSISMGKGVFDSSFGFSKMYTNTNYVVLRLPYTKYGYYRIASSEAELYSKAYKAIDIGLLYDISDIEGKQKVYAQFKTREGKESAVMSSSIVKDTTEPNIAFFSDIASTYVIDDNGYVKIKYEMYSSEAGEVYHIFYDEDGNEVGYTYLSEVEEGNNNVYIRPEIEDGVGSAKKMVIYVVDAAGNKSKEYSFDISIVNEFSEYETATTYIRIHNETGTIVEVDSTDSVIVIPAEIEGVKVTGIDGYAFVDNGVDVSIKIPDTITEISDVAFYDLRGYTLLVKENSAAHRFAVKNDIPFNLVTYKIGDVFEDGAVNSKDAIKLAQYLAKWSITLSEDEKSAADIFVDGSINSKDSIKLSQYLAKWDIRLE